MSKPTTYDFTEAEAFLNENYPLSNLYTDVCEAMSNLSCAVKYHDRETIGRIWSTLLTCADFLDTIQLDE